MSQAPSPSTLTLERLRAALPDCLDALHPDARPETLLETLFPVEQRREAWRRLRRQGFPLPLLRFSPEDHRRLLLRALRVAGSLALWLRWWPALVLTLPLALVLYWLSRHRAVEFPLCLKTVGELAVYLTNYRDHRGSASQWTAAEVAAKVRMIIAEEAGLPLDEVRPEMTLEELIGC
jgi:hypothetical protein